MYDIDLELSLKALKDGKIILYPTDTIWGLGCDATNYEAVKKIYEIKQRVFSKSLIVLVNSIEKLQNYVDFIPPLAQEIILNHTKPTTIIYQNAKNLSKNILAEDGSIAIRIPDDDFCKNLIKKFGKAIISTSANISGKNPPSNFNDISDNIKNQVDYIVKWRQKDLSKTKASSIIIIKKDNTLEYIRK
ncbi:MAG: threonylcarbamoyl-AMP synthase [Bacteroidales bacterium]|nr:threonylcarbamoyl-AMP synthase [Bacteroidales bacterium]